MNFELDLFQRTVIGWNDVLVASLQRRGLPTALTGLLHSLLPLLELALLVTVVALAAGRVDRLWAERSRDGTRRMVLVALQAAAGLFALRLLYWVYLHPSAELSALPFRWDYLVMAILGGLVLRRVPRQARSWAIALLSTVLVFQYIGVALVRVILIACLLGFAATRWRVTNRPGVRVAVHGALMGGLLAWLWWLRPTDAWSALKGWGLFSFVAFRHVSFAVESARGVPATLCGYLCYLLFFPNCMGAMEVYDEFHERNLARDPPAEFGRAALMVVRGNTLVLLALMIPMDAERVNASVGFASMWSSTMILFFRAAVGSIGIWDGIEGGALFLGIRLRPNFRDVLKAITPSQFWRAWRATMTNWLIRYVYIPLGGNRRHQTANIFAAFLVSTVWHCLGIPFLRPESWRPYELIPIVAWGALNCAGVATHAQLRRRRPPAPSCAPLLAVKWALAMVFGSLTVLLLGFSLGGIEHFGHVVRTLIGLEGW